MNKKGRYSATIKEIPFNMGFNAFSWLISNDEVILFIFGSIQAVRSGCSLNYIYGLIILWIKLLNGDKIYLFNKDNVDNPLNTLHHPE